VRREASRERVSLREGTRQKSGRNLGIRPSSTTFDFKKSGRWIFVYVEIYRDKKYAILRELYFQNYDRTKQEFKKESRAIFNLKLKVVLDAAKVSLATVYQKHSSLRTRKRMYRG
jgi:hypothetical protein